jgi:hypothetical protein
MIAMLPGRAIAVLARFMGEMSKYSPTKRQWAEFPRPLRFDQFSTASTIAR